MGTSATRAKNKYNKKNYVQCNMSLTQDLMNKFEFAKKTKGYESYPQTLEAALYALVSPTSPPPKWRQDIISLSKTINSLTKQNQELEARNHELEEENYKLKQKKSWL